MRGQIKLLVAALATAGLLAACGGGSDSAADNKPLPEPKPQVSVKVVGDSLSDSGTFGFKFTVQGKDSDGKNFLLWSERIAAQYESELCPHYQSKNREMTEYDEDKACANYAVGGALINPVAESGEKIDSPISVIHQIKHLSDGGISANDLLLVAAGSNDVAGLIEKVVAAAVSGNTVPMARLLVTLIDQKEVDAFLQKGDQGMAEAGILYMQRVAELMATSIKADLLGKGAQRVAVLNVPVLTKTPELAGLLAGVALLDSARAQAMEQLFDSWVKTFNATLSAALKDEPRVAMADFYAGFDDQIRNPAKYGFSNVTIPACSVLGVDDDIYNCGADSLAQNIPQGETSSDWWSSYMFSNAFHPTPYGHQQMSVIMQDVLKAKGWQP